MSLGECINNAAAGGELDPERAKKAVERFEEIEAQARGSMNPGEAARYAKQKTMEELKRDAVERQRRALLQAGVAKRNVEAMLTHRDGRGNRDTGGALVLHVDNDGTAPFLSAEQRRKAVRGIALAKMEGIVLEFRRGLSGRIPKPALLENIVHELFGGDTGDASARAMADGWKAAAEYLRLRFNAAGGMIGKLDLWGMPQAWDDLKVRQAGYDGWRAVVLPRLDRARMKDELTGSPMSDERLERALRQVHKTISTEGWSKIEPSFMDLGKIVGKRHADHRFLHFKDGQAWLEVNRAFGATDPLSTMLGHIEVMARDIGMMETFGPNVGAGLTFMEQVAVKEGAMRDERERTDGKWMRRAEGGVATARDVLALYDGSANRPVNALAARTMGDVRNVLHAGLLGSATTIAVPVDISTQALTTKFVGLPFVRTMKGVLELLTPLVRREREHIMAVSGLAASEWVQIAGGQMRYALEIQGSPISRLVAQGVMRLSGNEPWTVAGRGAFGTEFMGTMARNVERSFGRLDEPLQRTLARYGIHEAEWDAIRSAGLYRRGRASVLRPEEIEGLQGLKPGAARELATRYLAMIQTETDFAVPTGSLRARALLIGPENRPGGVRGEFLRSALMYKNIPLTIVMGHVRRGILEAQTRGNYGYLPSFLIGATLAGAVGLQLKEMVMGRDPRPMTDQKFWLNAMVAGGGLGAFGDLIFTDLTHFGASFVGTLAGPMASVGGDLLRAGQRVATAGIGQTHPGQAIEREAAKQALYLARRYTPGGTLWYLRTAYNRKIIEQLEMMADPKAAGRLRQAERNQRRDFGNKYWWHPGSTAPARAPDLSAAGGTR